MSSLKTQSFKAFVWDFVGKISRHGTSLIVTIILARLLDPSAFGMIAMVMVIVSIAAVFTDVGLGSALIQRRRTLPIHYNSVFYFNIFIGVSLTLFTFLSAGWLSEFYKNTELTPLIQTISFLFIINAFSAIQTNILRKNIDFESLTKSNVLSSVLSGIVGILMAYLGAGVWSLVAQVLLKGVFYNIHIWYVSEWRPSLQFSFKALKQLWGFGFRIFISVLINTIFSRLDIVIIGKLFPPATLGFYDQAKRFKDLIVQYSSGSVMAVLFPVLSKVQHDLQKFQRITLKTSAVLIFLVFFLLGTLYLIAEETIVLLLTDRWLTSAHYLKILLLSGFGYPLSALLVNILSSRGNSKAFLRLEIYKKILQTINFAIGFLLGIEGYLYGLVLITFIGLYLNIIFASREINLSPIVFIKPIINQILVTVSLVIILSFFFNYLHINVFLMILIKSIIFGMAYILINFLLKTEPFVYTKNEVISLIEKYRARKVRNAQQN